MSYQKKIQEMHQGLGIAPGYDQRSGLSLQIECQQLVKTELDVFDRQPLLDAEAFVAWRKMKKAAAKAEVILEIISAYRSAEYQLKLLNAKIESGQTIEKILQVNAAPGYSEHHTGLAIDIGCAQCPHLTEEFDTSGAFSWLASNAEKFNFRLSFPKDNPHGILYEPWHWLYCPD